MEELGAWLFIHLSKKTKTMPSKGKCIPLSAQKPRIEPHFPLGGSREKSACNGMSEVSVPGGHTRAREANGSTRMLQDCMIA
jgi:hypothetical protein